MKRIKHITTFVLAVILISCTLVVTATAADEGNTDLYYSMTSEACIEESTDITDIGDAYVIDESDLKPTASPETATSTDCDIFFITGEFYYDAAFEVLRLVNEERAKYGKSRLYMDPDLLEAAMQRSAEISLYFSHQRPDGTSCGSVSPLLYGENIAVGQGTAQIVMDDWMNSEGHKANILLDYFTSIGIGVFSNDNGIMHWVQCFGINQISSNCPKPANVTRTAKLEVGDIEGVTYNFRYEPVSSPIARIGKNIDLKNGGYFNIYFQNPGFTFEILKLDNTSYSYKSKDDSIVNINDGIAIGKKTGSTTVNIGTSRGIYLASMDLTVLNTYDDVEKNDWFYDSVIYMFNKGYMTGIGGTDCFGPNDTLTREQFAVIIYRIAGKPEAAYDGKFPDVPFGEWYTKPIAWANQNGVITGYENGKFGTGDPITREQLATMIYRYAKISGRYTPAEADLSVFEDYKLVSPWATEALQWCVAKKIITGANGGKYINPGATAKRCECATMVYRFLEQ